MMENAIYLLYDLCRLCLDEPGIHNIFESDTLIQDIFTYTEILHVSCNDKLPRTICANCKHKIEAAKDLKDYATRNYLYMRSLLDNGKQTGLETARPKVLLKPMEEVVSSSSENQARSSTTEEAIPKDTDVNTQTVSRAKSPIIQPEDADIARPKISVRSLDDINSGRSSSVVTSSDKDTTTTQHKRAKRSNSVPDVDKKSEDNTEHTCDHCGKWFSTSKKLYLHQRSHSKTLHCPLDACGKRFATKGDLQKHVRSHTGEKPYQCDLCDKRFAQNVTLKSHKEAVHEAKT